MKEIINLLSQGKEIIVHHEDGTNYYIESSSGVKEKIEKLKSNINTLIINHGRIVKVEESKNN